MKKLTKSQQKIYDFLREQAKYGVPPSVREICAATGLKSTSTVHAHLRTLEELGYISRQAGLNRSIRIEGTEESTQVPILGRVTAGMPILAVESLEGYVPFAVGRYDPSELFALRVKGESMIEAGILDGDDVIVRRQDTADQKAIVVAMLEDEATVKRLDKSNGHVRLLPENPAYDPIDGDNAQILGLVVAVYRQYHS